MSRRDETFRAYRVAAEMAVCASPLTGGQLPGVSDIDEVAAEIAHLIRNADDSDAVRFGLIAPKLRYTPNGSLEMDKGGANAFTQDYLKACLGESIAIDIDTYSSLFEDIPPPEDEPNDGEGGVAAAFHAEFGLSMRAAAHTAAALQQIGVDLASDVVELRRSELLARLQADAPEVGEEYLSAFLKSFGLASREAWDAPPPDPWRRDDVWPWYFERRLSLMLRPVLILSDEADPLLIYGVRQLDMGFNYASMLLERGIWPKGKLQSAAARAYVDVEINRRGDAFEQEIAALVEATGWRAFSGLAMKRFGAPKRLGDLDVLAVSPDGAVWIVIECKWFGAARTPREIANWLQDYHGKADDKLDRHLKRHAWIDRNRNSVAMALDLKLPEQVLGRVATTNPVPLAFKEGLPPEATVMTRRQLPESLRACE
jgi:hypothetical protein